MFFTKVLLAGAFIGGSCFATPFDAQHNSQLAGQNARRLDLTPVVLGTPEHGRFWSTGLDNLLNASQFHCLGSSKQTSLGITIRHLEKLVFLLKSVFATLHPAMFTPAFTRDVLKNNPNVVSGDSPAGAGFTAFVAGLPHADRARMGNLIHSEVVNTLRQYAAANNQQFNAALATPDWVCDLVQDIAPMAMFLSSGGKTYVDSIDFQVLRARLRHVGIDIA
jgi:hypothetical protein